MNKHVKLVLLTISAFFCALILQVPPIMMPIISVTPSFSCLTNDVHYKRDEHKSLFFNQVHFYPYKRLTNVTTIASTSTIRRI